MMWPYFLLLMILNVSYGHKLSDINVILRECNRTTADCFTEKSYSDRDYYRSALKLLSGGVFQNLFDQLDIHIKTCQPNLECSMALTSIRKGLLSGEENAFRILDASAKMPPAFMELTVTSLGDFDECLAITGKNEDWIGKYCMVDIFALRPRFAERREDLFQMGKYSFFNGTAHFFGLCFPSTCHQDDVRCLVASTTKDHPLKVTGDISCVTRQDVNLLNRLQNANFGQKLSIILLLSFMVIVASATGMDILIRGVSLALELDIDVGEFVPSVGTFINTFSILQNTLELPQQKASNNRMIFIDWVKLSIVLAGIFAHCISCLETPLGFFMKSKHGIFTMIFTNPFTQFFFNDGGLGWVTFLSGLSTFMTLSSLIQSRKLRFEMAIFDRWIRFAPVVMVITACDFTWELIISGPFASRVGSWITDKCSTNWYYNFFLVSVFLPALNICAPHTYYSSIDFLLFIAGIFVIYLLVHHPEVGKLVCYLFICSGLGLMGYFAHIYETPPAVMTNYISSQKVVNFLDTMQMSLYSFFHNYFIGILTAFHIKNGFKLNLSTTKKKVFWIFAIWLSLTLAESSPALHNTFDVIHPPWIPLYLISNRLFFTLTVTLIILYASSLGNRKEKSNDDEFEDLTEDVQEKYDTDGFSRLRDLFQGFCDAFSSKTHTIIVTKLSFSLFISNYFFIRSDFFSSRFIYESNMYPFFKRMTSFYVLIFIVAYIFHVFFVAPLEKLRKMINYRISEK